MGFERVGVGERTEKVTGTARGIAAETGIDTTGDDHMGGVTPQPLY